MSFLPQTCQIQTSKPTCKFPVLLIAAALRVPQSLYTDLFHNIPLHKTVWKQTYQEASLLFRFMTVPLQLKF